MAKISKSGPLLFRRSDLPLEVVILLTGSIALLITGILLFPVHYGALPYYENGLYGLFLVIFGLQMVMLGKTPFGDLPRTKLSLVIAVIVASCGIVACFIPSFNRLPRLLLFVCFGPGGLVLLIQMFLFKDRFRTWLRYRGIFWHLIAGCLGVYVLSMLIGLLILKHDLFPVPITAVVILIYGLAVLYLACVLWQIYKRYPEAAKPIGGDVGPSVDQIMLLFTGIFMLILGGALIPVNLGLLPFSVSAQIGLLIFIFAIQMLASGSTPIGTFPRSWFIIILGFILAGLGTISCIIPDILVTQLTTLVGVLNILGGIIGLTKIFTTNKRQSDMPNEHIKLLYKLLLAQIILNLLAIMFGTSMLIKDLIPNLAIGIILTANGGVLLYLLHILVIIDRMRGSINVAHN